jgi:ParB family chromosome partitioning protein
MAKRKRLNPASTPSPVSVPPEDAGRAPETRALANGWAGVRTRQAPIADVAGASATQAALEEVAGEMADARREGRLVQRIALEAIDEAYLVRDRSVIDPTEMTALEQSLRARGQQTPIEVVALNSGRYGLISGWRRLMALRALQTETQEVTFDTALCLVRAPQTASDAYLAMVEENEIRAGLSFYERARIAARAAEQGAYPTARHAVKGLFANASASKRSKITSFLGIYANLDDVLLFPASLSERMGLALAKALEADAELPAQIAAQLGKAPAPDAAGEQDMLAQLLKPVAEQPLPAVDRMRKVMPDAALGAAHDGIQITRTKGKMVLSGAGVTKDLMDALEAWLETHK